MLPLARTPMDRKAGQSLQKHQEKLGRILDSLVPWQKTAQFNALRRKNKQLGRGKETQIIVMLDGDMANNPLFKDAAIGK